MQERENFWAGLYILFAGVISPKISKQANYFIRKPRFGAFTNKKNDP